MNPFAYRRLETIEDFLGEQRFQKAIASTKEEWDRAFAEAEEIERNLGPCKRCRGKRTSGDDIHIPDGHCGECAKAEREEKAPNFPES